MLEWIRSLFSTDNLHRIEFDEIRIDVIWVGRKQVDLAVQFLHKGQLLYSETAPEKNLEGGDLLKISGIAGYVRVSFSDT